MGDKVLVADSEELRQLVELGRVCKRRKLRVNVSRSKVMKCMRMVGDMRLNVALKKKLLQEVGSHVAVVG